MSHGKTVQRGYGQMHRNPRLGWARSVARGDVDCARCGEQILPGEPWDLGHDDQNRSRWTGPEHARCNRATSAHRKERELVVPPGCFPRYEDGRVVGYTSREW
jgi:hypothetical protein